MAFGIKLRIEQFLIHFIIICCKIDKINILLFYFKRYFKLNNVFFIGCVSCLFYQSILLIKEFMSGKTVINISVEFITNDTLPAITICPGDINFQSLALINEDAARLYEEYLSLIEDGIQNKMNGIAGKIRDLYDDSKHKYYVAINTSCMNIQKCFINYLTPSKNLNNESLIDTKFLKSVVFGKIDQDLVYDNAMTAYNTISDTMESVLALIDTSQPNYFRPNGMKCNTLFHHSQSSWSNITMQLGTITVTVWLDLRYFPIIPLSSKIPLWMHSPKSLPNIEINRNSLVLGYQYSIGFSQWKIERLGRGYDTDCRDYDPTIHTRHDCIFDCYQDKMKPLCNTTDFVSFLMINTIRYFKRKNLSFSNCNMERSSKETMLFCQNYCHKECHDSYYSYTIDMLNEIKDKEDDDTDDWMYTEFTIEHNDIPDLFIRHFAEMSFITFVSNFGGLIGMWLGLSFFDIVKSIWHSKYCKNSTIFCNKLFLNNVFLLPMQSVPDQKDN